jgi:hypothetical protein
MCKQRIATSQGFTASKAWHGYVGFTCLTLAVFHPGPSMAQSEGAQRAVALSAPAQQFLGAVSANFAAWDLDHDGKLTRDEIEIDMQNPRITGEAAAALAALKLAATRSNYLRETRSYTRADIDAMEQKLLTNQKLDANFVRYFTTGLKKQREVPRGLFSEGIPRLTAIRQDWTSDCYFLATAGALAHVNPQAIVRLITAGNDGKFTVSFPGKTPVRVPAPTDTELATYSNARDGIWLSVLEKAYAIVRIKAEPQQASTKEPLDSVGFRTGNPGVVELLTGHKYKSVDLPANSHRPADGHLVQEVRSLLQASFREHLAVMLGNSHHDYAIVAYQPSSDTVTIHNPYNRGGSETYPDGVKVTVNDEGFFTLSTVQLINYFNYLYFELNIRAT